MTGVYFWSFEGWRKGFLPWLALIRLLHRIVETVYRWWGVKGTVVTRHIPQKLPPPRALSVNWWARRRYRLLLDDPSFPLLPAEEFERDRILILTGSLGAGGSERQAVNTLKGLKDRGLGDIALMCKEYPIFRGRRRPVLGSVD